ncbi:rRNA-processing protein CGR1 [Marchantia polymorpha subsp. ruderalis]|uniref:Coiled-coil domain-containing protein 86 n=2 Tax=Marchantia polymorpha TaxID=3197 RepID=A0AAF6BG03_MARPO|nr:hypothetical protein MARPO_0127s0012 [Marchantia polymorpha]BBN10937.1 hypothetical protein Mp_5g07720 [Marchantia polymorpha subsp. ruderalis]|eukprot:PTQ30225.1 hypothetical protein MARPO_0127s0012 [Marchantia polymorpha]
MANEVANPIDFRFLDEGLGGPLNNPKNKRKRREDEEERAAEESAMEIVQPAKKAAIGGATDSKPVYGKPTYDGTLAGKVSGRKWKQPKTCRAAALKVTGRKSTLEELNRTREIKKAYKARMHELKEQIRLNKRAKREQVELRKKIKHENEIRSQPVQRITNPKTLKKMSKKQRKLLRVIPD